MEENPFLTMEPQELVLIPNLQKLGSWVSDAYMAVLLNSGGQTLLLKMNMTIGYVKELD